MFGMEVISQLKLGGQLQGEYCSSADKGNRLHYTKTKLAAFELSLEDV